MVINQILDGWQDLAKPQRKFLATLFSTMLIIQSSINFLSLGRHSALSERTFRRQFRRYFEFPQLNRQIIEHSGCVQPLAFAQDASFIKKSGNHTFGLDRFWNGCHSRVEKGLELSLIAVIDNQQNASLALSAEQTPPNLSAAQTRIDFYLEHLHRTTRNLPDSIRYGVFDGFYAKQKFVTGVCQAGFHLVSKLRSDANLKHLFMGAQKNKGRRRIFAEKVDFTSLSKFETTTVADEKAVLYSQIVWSVALKRKIKLVIVKLGRRQTNLFSTDLELNAEKIFSLYRSRFTIEFLIRDAKQSAGLSDCQARDQKALEFHWNASFATVNLARLEAKKNTTKDTSPRFSMKSIKQQFFNEHLLKLFICKLGLEQTLIKYQEHFENLRNFAVISP